MESCRAPLSHATSSWWAPALDTCLPPLYCLQQPRLAEHTPSLSVYVKNRCHKYTKCVKLHAQLYQVWDLLSLVLELLHALLQLPQLLLLLVHHRRKLAQGTGPTKYEDRVVTKMSCPVCTACMDGTLLTAPEGDTPYTFSAPTLNPNPQN